MRKPQPHRINAVTALENSHLEIAFADGWTTVLDLTGLIGERELLHPLLSPTLFAMVTVGEWGFDASWDNGGDLSLPATLLRNLAEQQTGGPAEYFNHWMQRNGLSLNTAAESLGMTRRMIAYYRTGSRPIPKTVLLACKGWEAEHARQ